ncbi:MAG: hypothetical protein AB1899_00585 [Pseudomonadota bacterium]
MEERDPLLSEAYRQADHPEPPAGLDQAIRDAARSAVAPVRRKGTGWLAWAAPLSGTAVLVLALALLLRIQDEAPETLREAQPSSPPALPGAQPQTAVPVPATRPPEEGAMPVPQRSPAAHLPSPPVAVVPPPAPPRTEDAAEASTPQAAPTAPAMGQPGAEVSSTVPPAPAVRAHPSAILAAPPGEAVERNGAGPGVAERGAAAGLAKARSQPSSEGPEHWVETIRRLLREGRLDEAGRALAILRQRYPDHPLPDDLRHLERPAAGN